MEKCTANQQERFKYMREEIINLSQQKLADKIGIKQQTVADIESGRKQKIDTEILYKLLEEYLINTEWLLFGVGNPTKIDDSEENSIIYSTSNTVSIPYYSAKAAAGEGSDINEYPEKDIIHFDKRYLQAVVGHNLEHLSLITAEGDSMQPTIVSGDLLMVDDSVKEIRPNKIFVIRQGNKLRVKRLKTELTGETLIISDNPLYPIETMDKETEIIGQVVWNGNKEVV